MNKGILKLELLLKHCITVIVIMIMIILMIILMITAEPSEVGLP